MEHVKLAAPNDKRLDHMELDNINPKVPPSLSEVIQSRRTIGAFRPELPPREVVLDALDAARWAPNHKKTEPWHVMLLGLETVRAVIDLNSQIISVTKGSEDAAAKRKKWSEVPGWLAVTCDLAEDPFRREEDYAACCCFIQNLLLSLWSAGIGTKWTTGDVTRHPDFFRLLQIDSTRQRSVGLIWYGYPAVTPAQTRRPVESFLVELP